MVFTFVVCRCRTVWMPSKSKGREKYVLQSPILYFNIQIIYDFTIEVNHYSRLLQKVWLLIHIQLMAVKTPLVLSCMFGVKEAEVGIKSNCVILNLSTHTHTCTHAQQWNKYLLSWSWFPPLLFTWKTHTTLWFLRIWIFFCMCVYFLDSYQNVMVNGQNVMSVFQLEILLCSIPTVV